MTDNLWDAVIVGAGPAGAVFAAELAHRCPQKKLLLLDGQDREHPKPCGGLLAPDAQKLLAGLHLTLPNTVLADPQIFAVDTVDLQSGQRRLYQRHYLNMDRYAFDRYLLSRVPDTVRIVRARCTEIKEQNGIYTLKTNGGQTFRTTDVIGADGGNSRVRRMLIGHLPYTYTAIQEWYPESADTAGLPHYACIFDAETSDSCSWLIRKNGCVIFGGAFAKTGCHAAFEAQRARLEAYFGIRFGTPEKREACPVTSPRRIRDFTPGRPHVYLIGEAAGFISASSFEGISSAMQSGRMLADAFAKGKSSADIFRLYRKNTRGLRAKLLCKIGKRAILCNSTLRFWIMKSGVQSIPRLDGEGIRI